MQELYFWTGGSKWDTKKLMFAFLQRKMCIYFQKIQIKISFNREQAETNFTGVLSSETKVFREFTFGVFTANVKPRSAVCG